MFPSHSTKIVGVEHEYLAFGRKISPWTCTINDSPLHSSRVSSQPFLLFPSGGEEGRRFSPRGFLSRAGKTVRKWILEEKRMVDECKTRCRKGTRSNETPRECFRKRFCSILSYLLRETIFDAPPFHPVILWPLCTFFPWLNGQIGDIKF